MEFVSKSWPRNGLAFAVILLGSVFCGKQQMGPSGSIIAVETADNMFFLSRDPASAQIYSDSNLQQVICRDLPMSLPVELLDWRDKAVLVKVPVHICFDGQKRAIRQGWLPAQAVEPAGDPEAAKNTAFCPRDSVWEKIGAVAVCVRPAAGNKPAQALGPFPQMLVRACEQAQGGQACRKSFIDGDFAKQLITDLALQTSMHCLPGAQWDDKLYACIEGRHAYGPFSIERVRRCFQFGGGRHCLHMRWNKELVTVPVAGKHAGLSFSEHYAQNYGRIKQQARLFWPHSYGCAAFASTALKSAGFPVRQVLTTNEVEEQLRGLGWREIRDLSKLQPGDVVFTDKATSNIQGTWSHVYVFHRYRTSDLSNVYISDNQGRMISRDLYGGSSSRSMVAYRAP